MEIKVLDEEVLNQAILKWGPDAQINMFFEEAGELISSLAKYNFRGRGTIEEVAGEVADVMIMTAQLRLMIGSGIVDRIISEKIERLKGRLE